MASCSQQSILCLQRRVRSRVARVSSVAWRAESVSKHLFDFCWSTILAAGTMPQEVKIHHR
jgi:hypothetical protein